MPRRQSRLDGIVQQALLYRQKHPNLGVLDQQQPEPDLHCLRYESSGHGQ